MRGDFKYISFFFVVIFLHFPSGNSNSPLAPALYVFGDSLFDSGNNNFLLTLSKANFPPYGVNFTKREATGRFTNGKIFPDFIADFLGLPFPPPYKTIRISVKPTGLNYASGSCGILPETGRDLGKCLTMDDQINLFERTVKFELPRYYQNSSELWGYLGKSIFVVTMGSNDYLDHFQPTISDSTRSLDPQQFAQLLIDQLSTKLERLYNLGARKIVMFEIGPIGCIPSITRQIKHNGTCVEDVNKAVAIFNNHLPSMLKNLNTTLPGSNFVLGHAYSLATNVISNPKLYGLTDTSNPCCTALANGTSICIPLLQPCPNVDEHVFWDGYHLTETMYSLMATRCFYGTSACTPLNIQELTQI
ncbi:GDSL esterase/lipase [Actinidia chinensis var. chinensis]|uniref:GDSL esterase/lipase n=1 Tax=Actinidia chinensis var. chinensis TaxID=1590841 RepID=A0A2R6RUF6_ACTCC|nr:GDSL esterase/lipase [Actinidia chinensis var. chinensis]